MLLHIPWRVHLHGGGAALQLLVTTDLQDVTVSFVPLICTCFYLSKCYVAVGITN